MESVNNDDTHHHIASHRKDHEVLPPLQWTFLNFIVNDSQKFFMSMP